MSSELRLGIEIGGTKLQLGVGRGDRHLIELVREDVDVQAGAEGIIGQIERFGYQLCQRHRVAKIGIGFGGPVDPESGRVTTSHQIQGWDGCPLGDRLRNTFGLPILIDNDCNVAALGEAKLGAGQGAVRVFYVTVGTGIGGGFVVDGRLEANYRPAISEIGHLRPGIEATSHADTVESISSGWAIAEWIRLQIQTQPQSDDAQRLLEMCDGDREALTTKQVGAAALSGNALATAAIRRATKTLGWAIAQVITLLAPNVIVVGGGVSLLGQAFFQPLREQVACFVFPPLADSYSLVPAALGEEVVIHGALQLSD